MRFIETGEVYEGRIIHAEREIVSLHGEALTASQGEEFGKDSPHGLYNPEALGWDPITSMWWPVH